MRTGPSSSPSCLYLPGPVGPVPMTDTLEAILFVLKTGCRWRDLPREYGAPVAAWRRLRRWEEEGVLERIWRTILSLLDAQGKLDWGTAFLDGSFVPAKRGDLRLA